MKSESPVVVDLYRLAYNAGRPLTFDELVEGLPSAYQNDANRWWVAKEEAAGRILPPDPWPPSMLHSVKTEWVAEVVASAVHTKRLTTDRADEKPIKSKAGLSRDQLLYSANKERPPRVEEQYVVIKTRLVPWRPDIGAAGRRHVAGIKFREEIARIDDLGGRATKHDLEQALQLAVEALAHGSTA
jgi:hypothetical protein